MKRSFCTGDIDSIDKTGVIRSRRKFEINYAGIKVNREEIGALLEQRETVAKACVFAVPDEITGEFIGVVVVVFSGLLPEDGPVEIEIRDEVENTKAWLRDDVIEVKVSEKWYILDAIPKTERGKIDRRRVLADCLDQKA